MSVSVSQSQWGTLLHAVRDTAARFATVLLTAPAETLATKRWSVAQTAAHVVTVADLHHATMRPDEDTFDLSGLSDLLAMATVDFVAELNEMTLVRLTERDLHALADRLRASVEQLLATAAELGPAAVVDWLGGSRVPVPGILAHLLNELSIHGRDIARAAGVPWEIPPQDAVTFFDLFVVGMVRSGYGHLLDTSGPADKGRIVVQFRNAYAQTVTMVLEDGQVSIDDSPGAVDVRVTYHPTVFNLMMFGRVSKARAVLSGQVKVGGRRPWLLPKFLKTVRMPS